MVKFFPARTTWKGNCNTGEGMNLIKKPVLFIICNLLICHLSIPAQESILTSYERNFIRASLSEKSRVLTDAALDERSNEFIYYLYDMALDFALANGEFFSNDSDMIALVAAAARGAAGVRSAAPAGSETSVIYSGFANKLWALFQIFTDSYSRVEILDALAVLGKGNRELIGNLNTFLFRENTFFRRPDAQADNRDYPVIRASVSTLGILGDNSSFPVLFSVMTAGYSQVIIQESLKAMESIQGNYKDYLIEIIRKNPFPEKAAAFRIGAYNEKFSPSDRGEIAHTALEVSLENSGPAELSLRYEAITVLTRLKWSPAAPMAVRNFYKAQTDFSGGIAPKDRFVEAIACLGVMSSSEAAKVLALQLGFYNSQTERTGVHDETIILALINSLGELADKAAFDNLLYIGYLNYPDKIKSAAIEALNRLRW